MIHTDFCKCNFLLLAYPKGFSNEYEVLVPFYETLIELVPNEISLKVIVNNKKAERELKTMFPNKTNLEVLVINFFDEIWLRDCMGVVADQQILKFNYCPNYCSLNTEVKYYQYLNKLCKRLLSRISTNAIVEVPLNLDIGNFVHNGHKVFMTSKVLEDNPGREVEKIIKDYTGLEAIIVNKFSHDVIGHTDGYMAFLDQTTLFISEYSKSSYLKEDKAYSQMLKSIAVSNEFKVLPIFDSPTEEPIQCACKGVKTRSCLYSAKGIYVNFIRFNNYIFLPEYSQCKKAEIEYNWVNRKWLESLGFTVIPINCDLLAQFGGSLHCITFQL